jgi:hypothetical protein
MPMRFVDWFDLNNTTGDRSKIIIVAQVQKLLAEAVAAI